MQQLRYASPFNSSTPAISELSRYVEVLAAEILVERSPSINDGIPAPLLFTLVHGLTLIICGETFTDAEAACASGEMPTGEDVG